MIVKELEQAHAFIIEAVAKSKRVTVKFMGGNWIVTATNEPRFSKVV